MSIEVRPATAADATYIERSLTGAFNGTLVAVHDELLDATTLPAVIAWQADDPVGLLTYRTTATANPGATGAERGIALEWEVVSLAADRPGNGAGSALLAWLRAAGMRAGATRIWLVTTNADVDALRFYQQRGFDLVEVHRDAVTRARRLKPSIPLEVGGIPMRHELELELLL